MSEPTSFSIATAEIFLDKLQEFREIIQQDWSKVLNQWSNLKATWQDEQFDKFEPKFNKLAETYDTTIFECEVYISYLEKQIATSKKLKVDLSGLENILTIMQTGAALLGMATNPLPPDSTENLSAQQRYNSLPGIARLMSNEDLLSEAHTQEKDAEPERRKRELEKSSRAQNQSLSSASGDPPPQKSTDMP